MAMKTKYSKWLGETIIELYSSGRHLNQIGSYTCMPSRVTIDAWRRKYAWFDKGLADALARHTESLLISVHDGIDDADTMIKIKRADVKQKFVTWLVSRLNRKQYGDKMEIELTKKLNIAPILANAIANMKKVSVANPPQLIDAQVILQD